MYALEKERVTEQNKTKTKDGADFPNVSFATVHKIGFPLAILRSIHSSAWSYQSLDLTLSFGIMLKTIAQGRQLRRIAQKVSKVRNPTAAARV